MSHRSRVDYAPEKAGGKMVFRPMFLSATYFQSLADKSNISCLKNQPDAFAVQYTQLSLGQTTAVEPEILYS